MPWNIDNSRKRVTGIAASIPKIEISDLKREMTLENVKLANPKRVTGAHCYIALASEKPLTDALSDVEDRDAAKRVARQLHLYQRAVGRTADAFGAARIHFQGARLHSLIYRPFADHSEIGARAVGMSLAAGLVVRRALNPALKDDPDLSTAAGAAFGESLATMSGSRGDAELLFIGEAANQGAKAIDSATTLRISSELLDLLDIEDLGISVNEKPDGFHSVSMTEEALTSLAERYGIDWSLDKAAKKVEEDAENITLDSVGINKATAEIDKDRLSLASGKFNEALTTFGDLDGFTAIVEEAMGDNDRLTSLVRAFHIVRAELRHVAIGDYGPNLRVQYQGDRIQLLRHLPHDNSIKRAEQALRTAAAWNSSLTLTLPEVIDIEGLALATGVADGPTLISKLGTRGNRDVLAVGTGVRHAERIQRNLDGGEIGIDTSTLDRLPEGVQDLFEWRSGPQVHVCVDCDIAALELAMRAESYESEEEQQVASTATKVLVGAGAATLLGYGAKRAMGRPSKGNGGHGGNDGGHGHGGGNGHGNGGGPDHDGGGHSGGGGGGGVVPGRRWAP
jgi:class 3 adenylate cyclase